MSRRRLRTRLLIALTGLFPAWWQQRYREEFTDMLRALLTSGRRNTVSLALDIVVGALDAHLLARPASTAVLPAFPVVRKAIYAGLPFAALVAAVNVLANVVFPAAFDDNAGGPWNLISVVVVYLGGFVVLAAIGARGTRRSTTRHAGVKSGAAAGFVIATVAMLSFFAIDNLFLGTVSQQSQKVITFATSGQSSMRTFINLDLVRAALFVIPEWTITGALLGYLGGRLRSRTGPDYALVTRLLGTAWSVFRSSNSSFDFGLSHSSEPPVGPLIGTAVVTRLPLEMPRMLQPRPMRSWRWSPLSTVRFPGRSNNTGNSANGFNSTPGLVILPASAPRNSRWCWVRAKSLVAKAWRLRT